MILEVDNWYLGYSQILTDCRADDGGSVLLLSNADVDAMCAARILSYMLRSDGISYQLLPCTTYSSLEKTLSARKADTVKAVVLLNLGASRNLTRLFDSSTLDANIKVYVLDCRRPVHLGNIYAGDNVVVFWDGTNDDVPSEGDNLSGNESSSSEEDDDDDNEESDSSEGENEFQDEGGQEFEKDDGSEKSGDVEPESAGDTEAKEQESHYDGDREDEGPGTPEAKKSRTEEDDLDGDLSETGEPEGSNLNKSSVSPPSTLPTMTPRELHLDRRNRLRSYYSGGSFYGSPAAFVAYRSATQLRFGDVGDLLWLACVGVTDAFLHARLDVAGYTAFAIDLGGYCTRLFPNDMYHRVENVVYAEHITGRVGSRQQGLTKIGFSENGRVLCETDFRFFLLRHTSLFDAMVYSDFISSRFQLTTSRGVAKLQELFAKMGYPLDECRQPFAFMKPKLRRRLQEQIREHAEEYGLEHFEFTSFFRVTGYQSLLSASDTSYAVTALLENDKPTTTTGGDLFEQEEAERLQSFNVAFDALSSNEGPAFSLNGFSGEGYSLGSLVNGGNLSNSGGLGAGIRLAMTMQRMIMATAANLLGRNAITRLSHFRYAYINCTSQSENQGPGEDLVTFSESPNNEEKFHIFAKPLALTRLAHYLMDLHRENGRWAGNKSRPLILMAEKPRTKTYLVVGYEYPEGSGSFVKNRFGKNFELVAQSLKGTFRFDSFDSNVVEVEGKDVQRFLEQLHYLMDAL